MDHEKQDPKINFEEMAHFLTSLDGQKRNPRALRQLATPRQRLDYSLARAGNTPGASKYRLLFDKDAAERSGLNLIEIEKLGEEFRKLVKGFQIQALLYYRGAMTKEQISKEIEKDTMSLGQELCGSGYSGGDEEGDHSCDGEEWKQGLEDNKNNEDENNDNNKRKN